MRIARAFPVFTLFICFGFSGCRENHVSPTRNSAQQTSAQLTEELEGWKAAKWGMTPDEVRRALGGEAKNQVLPAFTKDEWNLNIAGLKLPNYAALQLKVDVHFVFDANVKLRGVTMALAPEDHSLIRLDAPFEYFEKELSAKYGPPTRRQVTDGLASSKSREMVWNLRLTTITLSQTKYPNPAQWAADQFSVFYEPRQKNDAL